MSEIPRQNQLEIVSPADDSAAGHELETPKPDIFEQLLPYFPDDFDGKLQVKKHGVILDDLEDSTSQRLTITLLNTDMQSGPILTFARISFRDLAVPEHPLSIFFVNRVGSGYRLQEQLRRQIPAQPHPTEAFRSAFKDSSPEVVDLVSYWIQAFHEIKDVPAI